MIIENSQRENSDFMKDDPSQDPVRGSFRSPAYELLSKLHADWKTHRPVTSSMLGARQVGPSEDLSDTGLSSWREVINSVSLESARLLNSCTSVREQAVLCEIRRFCLEQIHIRLPSFEKNVTPYVQLILYALLPFYLRSRDSFSSADFAQTVEACSRWLDALKSRLASGQVVSRATDRRLIKEISGSLLEWVTSDSNLDQLSVLVDRLASLEREMGPTKSSVPTSAQTQGLRSKDWYLREILQISEPLYVLEDRLVSHLDHWITKLAGEHNILSSKARLSGPESSPAPEGLAELNQLILRLADFSSRMLLRTKARPPRVLPLPSFLTSIVSDATYLAPSAGGLSKNESGWVLNQPHFLFGPLGANQQADVALLLAHEVSPGHAEQLVRAGHTEYNLLFEISRSPIAFEGWGVYSEGVLFEMRDLVPLGPVAVSFQRVRRAAAALIDLSSITRRKAEIESKVEFHLSRIDERYRKVMSQMRYQPLQPLVYALGLLKTEDALAGLQKSIHGGSNAAVTEAYLSAGPVGFEFSSKLAVENWNKAHPVRSS